MREPLFILAPPRSFTSVVCAMIGNHPDMIGLAETNLFASPTVRELRDMHRSRPRFAHGLLRSIAQLGLGGQTSADVAAAERWLDEHPDLSTADVFRDLMDWANGRGLIDKSPMYVYAPGALERIVAEFPGVRFLHLTRHPRATCESIYETHSMAQGARGGALAQSQQAMTPGKMWLEPHRRIMAAMALVPAAQQMRVRGEALMSAPREHLPRIAEWLGIRTDAAATEAMLHPERSPFASMGPDNARLGNDPRFLQSPALRPYREKPSDLDAPLSWDPALGFDDELRAQARAFGY